MLRVYLPILAKFNDHRGGDFHFATDATFAHSHRKSAGDSPSFYNPKYFISKAQVDAVGDRIALLRAGPARKYTRKVPDEAVDGCTKSFDAARGQNETARGEHFDDTGIMALICRHDIPLFLANIDTPGEQQKYAIALVEHIFQFLPPHATAALLYDVVCVLDRSQQRVRIPFFTSVFFANMAIILVPVAPKRYRREADIRTYCYARLWSSMGLSNRVQSSHSVWSWAIGR